MGMKAPAEQLSRQLYEFQVGADYAVHVRGGAAMSEHKDEGIRQGYGWEEPAKVRRYSTPETLESDTVGRLVKYDDYLALEQAHAKVTAKLTQAVTVLREHGVEIGNDIGISTGAHSIAAQRDALKRQASNLLNALRSIEKDARQMREQSEAGYE